MPRKWNDVCVREPNRNAPLDLIFTQIPNLKPQISQMIAAVSAEPLRIMRRAVKVTCRFVQLEPAIQRGGPCASQ